MIPSSDTDGPADATGAGTVAVVAEIGAALARITTIQDLITTLSCHFKWLLPPSHMSLCLLHEDKQSYDVLTPDGKKEQRTLDRGLIGWVFRHDVALDISNLEDVTSLPSDIRHREASETIGALLILPLRARGSLFGALTIRTPQAGALSNIDRSLLALVSLQVSATADNAILCAQQVNQSERRYRQMFELNRAIKLLIDPESGSIVDANPAAATFYGYSLQLLRGMPVTQINVMPPAELTYELQQAITERRAYFTFRHRLASGEVRDVEVHSSPIEANGKKLLYSIIHDITERRQMEDTLRYQAMHDALTGLANRYRLQEQLTQLMHASQQEDSSCALLLIDLDRFKEINNTFGHHAGDQLLCQVATRLLEIFREPATIARLGGDEFAVLLPHTDETEAVQAAQTLVGLIDCPFVVEGQHLAIDGSIGIAICPQHGTDAATLLRRADVAMYAAKRGLTRYLTYEPQQDRETRRRLALSGDLRHAIERSQLFLEYQPKVNLRTGAVVGAEALLRWQHPQYGLVSPGEFIPLAESTGSIASITRWVLSAAVRQWCRWRDSGLDLTVCINLSARSLHDGHLVNMIMEILGAVGGVPDRLSLEITESDLMVDPNGASRMLERLSVAGIHIAIDDFGTGYSSLASLDTLPAQELKIDRSFVVDMDRNDSHFRIVSATINLAHDLTLRTVAEGVETQQVLDLLSGLGCDVAQGYYFSRPIPGDDLAAWVIKRHQTL